MGEEVPSIALNLVPCYWFFFSQIYNYPIQAIPLCSITLYSQLGFHTLLSETLFTVGQDILNLDAGAYDSSTMSIAHITGGDFGSTFGDHQDRTYLT